ncbi:histidine-containing phosphotransfer protein 2-like [Eucalyptus grandis]|uniref:histidine-containing phosphotransfer protein 2-like n=1 Tax=Eucalyptus grandis TaxID=71139 RepID=UPI00192E83E1|nr:histidine-containing phosphotransfer protein 2-like [Eucalyptus grandis]
MASERDALVHGLYTLISNLEEQGLLNSNFASGYQIKPHGFKFFPDLVLLFCNNIEVALRELVLALELPAVDYDYTFKRYLRMKESTTRIGACALGLAVDDLLDALETPSREG